MNKMETRKKESQTQTQNFSQVFSQTLSVHKNTPLKHKKFEQRDLKMDGFCAQEHVYEEYQLKFQIQSSNRQETSMNVQEHSRTHVQNFLINT